MRRRIGPAAAVAAAGAALAMPAAAGAQTVKPPKAGKYSGSTSQRLKVSLFTTRRSVSYMSFRFRCARGVTAGTGLQEIRVRRSRRGYRFRITAYGSVSFSDDGPEQNGRTSISGRFSRDARSVRGRVRVRVRRCGDSGSIRWRARRRTPTSG